MIKPNQRLLQRDINGSGSSGAAHARFAVTALKKLPRLDAQERIKQMSTTELKSIVMALLEPSKGSPTGADENPAMQAILAFRDVLELEFYLGSQQAMLQAEDGTFSEEELAECKAQISDIEDELIDKECAALRFLTSENLYPMSRDEAIAKFNPYLAAVTP